ncbi:MAG: flippase [Solirubrobacterales bacterium]|nr:flippase [Solirubrobacterales bacterium]
MTSAEEATAAAGAPRPASTGRIVRNSVLQAGADAIGKLGTIVLYAVVARKAGVEAFGDFTTAASLSILVMVAAFGMDYRITRLVARGETGAGEAFWSAILLKLLLGVVLLAVVLAVAVAGPYSDRVVLSTTLLGVAIIVELTMMTPHAVFRGLEQLRVVAIALTLYRGTLAVAGIVVLLAGGSIVAVAYGWLVSACLALWYTADQLRRAGLHFPFRATRASLRAVGVDSFALGLAGVLGATLSRLDIVILGVLKDSEAVALYGGAYRLMESTQFLTTALALSTFPALARLSRITTPTIAEATAVAMKVVLIVTVPIAVFFVVYAEPLLKAMYGPEFGGARTTLQLLGPIVIATGIYSLVTFVLSSQQRQRPIVVALMVATVVNVAGNLVLIPSHGVEGAAVAWAATTVMMCVLLVWSTLRISGPMPVARMTAGPLVAAAAMAGVGVALGAGAVSVVPAIVTFGVALLAVERSLFPEDVDRVVRAVRRRRATD